jgi:hypothetical protein
MAKIREKNKEKDDLCAPEGGIRRPRVSTSISHCYSLRLHIFLFTHMFRSRTVLSFERQYP